MDIQGIFKNKQGEYFWLDCLDEYEWNDAVYFADADDSPYHTSIKSALYDDMTDYIDQLQNEESLPDNELYVVTYFKFEEGCWGLNQPVDFGITKAEIIENVKNQKYVEGASYFTMGQMFYTTKMMMEEQ